MLNRCPSKTRKNLESRVLPFWQRTRVNLPSATPHGYWRPLTFLPFTSITTLLPTTARGIFSWNGKTNNFLLLRTNYCIHWSLPVATDHTWRHSFIWVHCEHLWFRILMFVDMFISIFSIIIHYIFLVYSAVDWQYFLQWENCLRLRFTYFHWVVLVVVVGVLPYALLCLALATGSSYWGRVTWMTSSSMSLNIKLVLSYAI